jgi:hypothetical protein
VVCGLFASACASAASHADLDSSLCTSEDLGGGYQELTTGDFTPHDFAEFGSGDGPAVAGLQGGRFVVFKQVLPRPPFNPQINVVCGALEFSDESRAISYFHELKPETASIGPLLVGKISNIEGVDETALQDAHDPPLPEESVGRMFRLDLGADGTTVVRVGVRGSVMWAVGAGGPGVSEARADSALADAAHCVVSGRELEPCRR